MKIATTYKDGKIFQHFGHTEQFQIFDCHDDHIHDSQIVDAGGEGHGALGGFLKAQGVDTLICGGIGGGAINALAKHGINLCAGVEGDTTGAVEALLAGKLKYTTEANCDHHGHGEGHTCGGHHHGHGHSHGGCGGGCHH